MSLASSANGLVVNYVVKTGVNSTDHSFGIFADNVTAAAAIMRYYQGNKANPGGTASHYNSNEAKIVSGNLADLMRIRDGAKVNVTSVMYTAFYNYAQARLVDATAGLVGAGIGRATWSVRPTGPTLVSSAFDALNYYKTYCGEIYSGTRVCIEMSKREYASGVMAYVYYLLGAGNSTFTFRLGASGGNVRVLHLQRKCPVGVMYDVLIADSLQPPTPFVLPAMPGLAANAPANNEIVGQWDWGLMDSVMDVVTRSLPVAGDIEAGALKVMIDMFAEQFEGVHIDHVSGIDERHTGYNAFLDQGERGMSGGSALCCFMSYGMRDSAVLRRAVLRGRLEGLVLQQRVQYFASNWAVVRWGWMSR